MVGLPLTVVGPQASRAVIRQGESNRTLERPCTNQSEGLRRAAPRELLWITIDLPRGVGLNEADQ